MAVTGTGKWTRDPAAPSTSVEDRDFCSGDQTSGATYQQFDFGFSAASIVIVNSGSGKLVYRFPRRRDGVMDSGIVAPNSTLVLRDANKVGIDIRHDGAASAYVVSAFG